MKGKESVGEQKQAKEGGESAVAGDGLGVCFVPDVVSQTIRI